MTFGIFLLLKTGDIYTVYVILCACVCVCVCVIKVSVRCDAARLRCAVEVQQIQATKICSEWTHLALARVIML